MYLPYSNLHMGTWDPYYEGYHCSCCCHGNYEFPQMWSFRPPIHPPIKPQLLIPFIETVDPAIPKKEVIIGQPTQMPPSLEYMSVEGAVGPTISLKIVSTDGTTSWEENPVAPGYHMKSDFPVVQPRSKIIIEVKEVVARLRWWETLSY
jgi:hypothetical protein